MGIARTLHWCKTLKEQFGDILHFLSLTRIDEKLVNDLWQLSKMIKQVIMLALSLTFIQLDYDLKLLISVANCYYIVATLNLA